MSRKLSGNKGESGAYNGQVQPSRQVTDDSVWSGKDVPGMGDLGFTKYEVGKQGQPAEGGKEGQTAEAKGRANGTYNSFDIFDKSDEGISGE